MAKKQKKETPDFRIPNKSMTLKNEVINIASHKGLGYGAFLRGEIIKVVNSSPAEQRKAPRED